MPSKTKKEDLTQLVAHLTDRVSALETNLSLISSRLIRLETNQKDMEKTIDKIAKNANKEVTPVIETQPVITKYFYEPYLDILKKWTNKEICQVVYDSINDGLTAHTINHAIEMKSNIMILVKTDKGEIFGSYNTTQVPKSEDSGYGFYINKDMNFFMFSLKGNIKAPTKITKKDKVYSLKVYSNDNDEWVIGTHCGFYVGASRNSFISNKLKMFYDGDITSDSLTGSHFPTTFDVSQVIAIQWK
ncbi:hypothetical protein ENUP19_0203G0002 [Entamoeba nuttalli]|uniref:TLDc domain-containing protein n=1 Tax=Entamoeba nuttalli TaxID=412467 RepID=A0ABQ0DNS5_9EUKA